MCVMCRHASAHIHHASSLTISEEPFGDCMYHYRNIIRLDVGVNRWKVKSHRD